MYGFRILTSPHSGVAVLMWRRSCLEPAVLQLLLEQQHHHELQLQQLQHQHQTQVAEIKAMAIQRFKELQQQLAAHTHQQQ